MKNYFTALMMITLLYSCDEAVIPTHNTLSIIIDRTEEKQTNISSEYLLKFLETKSIYDAVEISLLNISDTKYNDRQSFEIGIGKTGMLSNEDRRRKRIGLLKKRFAEQLKTSNQKTYRYNRSDIFCVFIKELNRLSKLQGNRTIILLSDLKEHSSLFSVYGKQQSLFNNLKEIKKVFESSILIADNLEGITIHIMYQPNVKDAELFSQLIKLYKSIVEPRGTKIIVGYHHKTTL